MDMEEEKMNKQAAVETFKRDILPSIHAQYEKDGRTDYPARREAWNDFTDYLCKDGKITSRQYATWLHPAYCDPPHKEKKKSFDKEAWISTAKVLHNDPGVLEIDDDAKISKSEGGAWVSAWVWIPNAELNATTTE